jgi:hypothetical protein
LLLGPRSFETGSPNPLKLRVIMSSILGGFSLLCLFLIYNLSGAMTTGILSLPIIWFIPVLLSELSSDL